MTELLTHRQYANGEATSLEVEASGSVNIDITVYQSTDHSFAYDNSETVNITTSGSTTHPLSAFTATSDSIYWLKVSMNGGQLSSASIITDSSTLTLLGRGTELGNARDSAGLAQPEEGVQQGYAQTSLTDGLVAYYPFDSSEVTPAVDEALGNHGTINGATYTSGQIGQALSFDSSNGDVVSSTVSIQNSHTFSAWVNAPSGNGTRDYICGIASTSTGTYMGIDSNGEFYYRGGGIGGGILDATTSVVRDDSWHHVVATVNMDTGIITTYVDGLEDYSVSGATSSHSWNNVQYEVGNRGDSLSGRFMQGLIDEPRIYDRALSTPEVEALYERTKPHMISPSDTL
jgi:hypothetical protein